MKKLLQRTVLLFGTLIAMSGILYGQSDSVNICSEIHYSDEEDKACQECWENHAERQAKYLECAESWNKLEIAFKDLKTINAVLRDINLEQSEEITTLEGKVKRNRNGLIIVSSGAAAFMITTLSLK